VCRPFRVWNTGDLRMKLIIMGPSLPSLQERIAVVTGRSVADLKRLEPANTAKVPPTSF
jgi:hypothetical protein